MTAIATEAQRRDESVAQLSGRGERGAFVLSVLAKRSYVARDGRCVAADNNPPLRWAPLHDAKDPKLMLADADVFPWKPLTDVVITGHAYNHPRTPAFIAEVRIVGASKRLLVVGDRRAETDLTGRVRFSPPALVDRVPLTYARAYGGRDTTAEARHGNPAALLRPYLPADVDDATIDEASPFSYPRNPSGCGYLVEATPEAVDQLRLPNLESADDPLTPDRLAVGEPGRWPLAPVPASLGWLDYGWFPRCALFGSVPEHDPLPPGAVLPEARLGLGSADLLTDRPLPDAFDARAANGASLGLAVPWLRGGERLELTNLHPSDRTLRLVLPDQRPRLYIDGRKRGLIETDVVLQTVAFDTDTGHLTLVWRGTGPALRPHLHDELERMPFRVVW
jgi:hypothetical protein